MRRLLLTSAIAAAMIVITAIVADALFPPNLGGARITSTVVVDAEASIVPRWVIFVAPFGQERRRGAFHWAFSKTAQDRGESPTICPYARVERRIG